MNKSPSILIIINGFFPKVGGSEKQAQLLARGFQQAGCPVQVLTLQLEPTWLVEESIDGIPVKRITYPRIPLAGPLLSYFKILYYLISNRNKWDIYYVVIVEYMAAIAIAVGAIFKIPTVLKFTGLGQLGVKYIDTRRFSALLKRIVAMADAFITVTDKMEHEVSTFGFSTSRIHTIPNAVDRLRNHSVDREEKRRLRDRLQLDDCFTFVFAGRFVAVKDIPTLLKAWRKSVNAIPDQARLVLLGEGPLFIDMIRLSETLNISDSTMFLGNRRDIHLYLRAADAGVIASRSEGLSNTLLEMMSNRLIIIASDIEGNRSTLQDQEEAILFTPGDADALSKAIIKVIRHQGDCEAMALRAEKKIIEDFSVEKIVNDYLQLFDSLIQQKFRVSQ